MNILQQNPQVFTTGTCAVPYLFESVRERITTTSEFIAMPQHQLLASYQGFLKQGAQGWFEQLTPKPYVISKARTWDTHLNTLFSIYQEPKFIVCLRDLRGIVASFEKMLVKYTYLNMTSQGVALHTMPLDQRIQSYRQDQGSNLGRPLQYLPHVYEWMQKRPNNFFIYRWEDFCQDPIHNLQLLYSWMGWSWYEHDLNNIPKSDYYEHDTVYRSLVDHTTRPQFDNRTTDWREYMSEHQSNMILHNCHWFYQTFYPHLLP